LVEATSPTEHPRPAATALGELTELWRARRLLSSFIWNDLKQRYVGSSIGFFWTVVNPTVELFVYTFVFHVLIGVKFHPSQNTPDYVLFLFCAMVSWNAFADGLVRATGSITGHAHLIRKLNFPPIVLPAHMVLSAVVNQAFRNLILFIAVVLIGGGISWHALLFPALMLVQAAFTLGLGLLLATAAVYFRDMTHWVNAALMFGMFMTPVFYPASAYPRQWVLLLYPNPMAQIVGIGQGLLLNQHIPAINSMVWAVISAVVAIGLGTSVFAHHKRAFADQV
jgi:ABC-type polysaccharide/polyol phosphate export permease